MNQTKVASGGFSLIEVMIVLVIIGVLLLVATPGYQESMRKSHRADGMRDLMELVSRQERFYAQNSRYTNDIETADGLNLERTISSESYYTLSVQTCSENDEEDDYSRCYILLAEPRGKQTKDACGTLTVNSKGERDHSGSADLKCW
jgi:type IV pilus assembly protein PilE